MTPAELLRKLSLTEEVGQLLIVGVPGSDPDGDTSGLASNAVGGLILTGHSYLSTGELRTRTDRVDRALSVGPCGVLPLITVDQEGGKVQNLRGSGFLRIPSAVLQGRMTPAALQSAAHTWALELAAGGIDLDLAPVADVVAGDPKDNPPVGVYDREYGSTAAAVGSGVEAFVKGFAGTGTGTTVKHFPGLGNVHANTDTTSSVHDDTIAGTAQQMLPFTDAMAAGASAVMVSSAIYDRIDPGGPAAFSTKVITGLLRGQLHWNGVVVSDDLGSARAVSGYSPGRRAVDFVEAGGDLILTVTPDAAPAMITAVLAEARSSASFRRQVDQAVARILRLKLQLGLVSGTQGPSQGPGQGG